MQFVIVPQFPNPTLCYPRVILSLSAHSIVKKKLNKKKTAQPISLTHNDLILSGWDKKYEWKQLQSSQMPTQESFHNIGNAP